MAPNDADRIPGADDLYGVEPSAFTAARNALAKALRSQGDREAATTVAALRRPPATAWALNQVARTQPDLVAGALAAGAELRSATDAAMGGDRSALSEATVEERSASAALVRAALDRLAEAEVSGGAMAETRLAATVRAAVLDDDVAHDLRRGTLAADHDRSGLGLGAELDAWLAPAPSRHLRAVPDPPTKTDAGGQTPPAASGRSIVERRAAEREAKDAARRAAEEQARRDEADRAHRRLIHDLRAEASKAAKRAARLDRAAAEAEAEAADARADADEAAAAAERAALALDEAVAGRPPDD